MRFAIRPVAFLSLVLASAAAVAAASGEIKAPKGTYKNDPYHSSITFTGKFDIVRKDSNLGQESDATGEYVSPNIGVEIDVIAKRP